MLEIRDQEGAPIHPRDILNHCETRLGTVHALAAALGADGYPNADGPKRLILAIFTLEDDFRETHAAVEEWFKSHPEADIGGRIDREEVAHG